MDEQIAALKRAAWEDRDVDSFDFYSGIEWELKKLRAVGRTVASLYKNTSDDNAWSALYEALSDAGLLP